MQLTERRSSYHRPRSIDAALAHLAEPGSVVIAGGTDHYPSRLHRPVRDETIVDVSAIAELRAIEREANGWRFGGATTWTDVARATLPPSMLGLQQAARQIGGRQIQNVGTIAGNLCTASPAADSVPPLLTLDASVEIRSEAGVRIVPLTEFILGYRSAAILAGELVSGILVPDVDADARGAFVKLGQRAFLVISIAMVAAVISVSDQVISQARIAIGSASAVAQRLPAVEAALVGRASCDTAAIHAVVRGISMPELGPIDDVRASAEYRVAVAGRLVTDCVANALSTPARP